MSDSWEAFSAMLGEESAALARLNAAALELTQALVCGDADRILAADRELGAARVTHHQTSARRRGMQVRGFGTMSLQQVCRYAPRPLYGQFHQRLCELTHGSIALRITVGNNKALILGGLDRLMRITTKLQASLSERPGVYRRRGFVPPPSGSVLVSSKC